MSNEKIDHKISFSNPRLYAKFEAWPLGFKKVGNCTFQIEHNPSKGWRVIKTTTGKPKLSTYSGRCCIVDGSDGKTYIIQHSQHSYAIIVSSHDFKTPPKEELGFDHYVARGSDRADFNDPYWALNRLIGVAYNDGDQIKYESTAIQVEKK